MARGWGRTGGIAYLAGLLEEHPAALDHDLITQTRYTLDDVPSRLGWSHLAHFVAYLKPGSALHDELHPEYSSFDFKTALLADIFDLLGSFRYTYVAANSKSKPRRPKPYPRPWTERKSQHYGKDPIPASQFAEWWDSN